MLSKTKHYFASANTAQGFIDYFSSNLQTLEKVYILKGGPGTGKSTIIKSIGNWCDEKGIDCELLHCCSDPDSLDGIIIPHFKFAVVDGTAPHIIEPTIPGAIEEYVNLGIAWDSDKLKTHKKELIIIKEQIEKCFTNANKCFAKGLLIHNEWEKIYIKNMNFVIANLLSMQTANLIINNAKFEKKSMEKHRFFGTSTPLGSIDYIESLTFNISKRYLIKGRPGTGKSTLLKKIVSCAINKGIDVEIYHCGFDANSLDMIILPELDVCVFDSTAPHLYEPSSPNDEIIDMYAKCIKIGTDEKYKREIQGVSANYNLTLQKGIEYLADAKKLHDEMEKYYIESMDFNKIDIIRDEIINNLDALLIFPSEL